MALIQGSGTGPIVTEFYPTKIENSLRFNDDDSAYLGRTPSVAGNRKTWTFSTWVKKGNLSTYKTIFSATAPTQTTNGDVLQVYFDNSADKIAISHFNFAVNTLPVLRDISAWYHVVISYDSTQAAATDRVKVFINGVNQTDTTSTYPDLNLDSAVNSTIVHSIGRRSVNNDRYLDGYLAETHFIDGQALDPTSFGEFKNGVWIPKRYIGTYGVNGFYLDYDGDVTDKSGNANDWTPVNLASTDYVLDSPTENYATLNPIASYINGSLNRGNLGGTESVSSLKVSSNLAIPKSGKWYAECMLFNSTGTSMRIGLCDSSGNIVHTNNVSISSIGGVDTWFVIDSDNEKVEFYREGPVLDNTVEIDLSQDLFLCAYRSAGVNQVISIFNFGQDSSFAGNKARQGNTDDRGRGDFYYKPPSGYLALCSSNLPEPEIGPNSSQATALQRYVYDMPNALRFNDDDAAYFKRTPSVEGNRRTWTFSTWVKRGNLGISYPFLSAYTDTENNELYFGYSGDRLLFQQTISGSSASGFSITTFDKVLDNDWHHVSVSVDIAQATTAERIRIYLDGIEQKQDLAVSNAVDTWVNGTNPHLIGFRAPQNLTYGDYYLAETHFIDGQALTPETFGEFKYGNWVPKQVTNVDYGTNGFYLDYQHGTAEGFSSTVYRGAGVTPLSITGVGFEPDLVWIKRRDAIADNTVLDSLRGAGIRLETNNADVEVGYNPNVFSSFDKDGFTTGLSAQNGADGGTYVAWAWDAGPTTGKSGLFKRAQVDYLSKTLSNGNGQKYTYSFWVNLNSSNPSQYLLSAYSAVNSADNIYIGNSSIGMSSSIGGVVNIQVTSNQALNVGEWYHVVFSVDTTQAVAADRVKIYTNGTEVTYDSVTYPSQNYSHLFNTAQRHSLGILEWDLTTAGLDGHLADVQFVDGQALTPSAFRDESGNHKVYDGEWGTNGFYLDFTDFNDKSGMQNDWTNTGVDITGIYPTLLNTDGTIASHVKASDEKGFSIVSYTGTGANATVGHGLSQAPDMMIVKSRSGAYGWHVYHRGIASDAETDRLLLNTTDAAVDDNTIWNDTAPTDSVFSVGIGQGVNLNSTTYINYCFHSVPGYSSIGSYTGTGAAGNTVTTGFKPAWVMIKNTTTGNFNWIILDTTRDPETAVGKYLFADTSAIEGDTIIIDVTDTGFVVNATGGGTNGSGDTYVYMAFADTRDQAFWKDRSGNNHDWEHDSITASDVVEDAPTSGFATIDSSWDLQSNVTYSEGGLKAVTSGVNGFATTMPAVLTQELPKSGKWYLEFVLNESNFTLGRPSTDPAQFASPSLESTNIRFGTSNNIIVNNVSVSTVEPTNDKVLSASIDVDNNIVTFYIEGVDVGSVKGEILPNYDYQLFFTANASSVVSTSLINCGQDATFASTKAPSVTYSDINGQGEFFYEPPRGFLALNKTNLSTKKSRTNLVTKYPYSITNSLRFNDDDSAYLARTPAVAGNRKTWTFSTWVKRCGLLDTNTILAAGPSTTDRVWIRFNSADNLEVIFDSNIITTTSTYNDTVEWMHLQVGVDTSQSVDINRVSIYINGIKVSSFSSAPYPPLNEQYPINNNVQHRIGEITWGGGQQLDGYLAETHFIDGAALTPDHFGEFVGDDNVWVPKTYTGSYGNNGFYLNYSNGTSNVTLGQDTSGRGNDWTLVNHTPSDQVIDNPVKNFATLDSTNKTASVVLSEGNLKITSSITSGGDQVAISTIRPQSVPIYYEVCCVDPYSSTGNTGGATFHLSGVNGVANYVALSSSSKARVLFGFGSNSWQVNMFDGAGSINLTEFVGTPAGTIMNIALDESTGSMWVGKDGVWYNSGNPATGTNPTYTFSKRNIIPGLAAYRDGVDQVQNTINFGQDATFANTKSPGVTYQDSNGQGEFFYQPPAGFLALNDVNINGTTVEETEYLESNLIEVGTSSLPQDHFNTVLWTGNGSTQSITGVNFQPDLSWVKARNGAFSHYLNDSVRGAGLRLQSNSTNEEADNTAFFLSFDSDGFSLDGGTSGYNQTSTTYVAWNWKAGNDIEINRDGSIESIVSVNRKAGFSIVGYTGGGVNSSIGHGLNQAPELIIAKVRNASLNWYVHTTVVDGSVDTLNLNLTNAAVDAGQNAPTNTVFYNNLTASYDHIAYCFHSVEGFSKFGSYTGNGSADGPFVYTGFRPAYVMFKRTDAAADWYLFDKDRLSYNGDDRAVYPNLSLAESSSSSRIDFLSNGFKIRIGSADPGQNASGGTYIYMAFSEMPFKYSSAR